MHEDEIRALVRNAVARHFGDPAAGAGCATPPAHGVPVPPAWKQHIAHGRFVFLAPTDPDAPCIVEPHVKCHHCGFCQSYGH
jgi:hypothetical protein